ncbi:wall-associated receptor kinase 2-like [Papaver somniferum]|uniref:wall-associated receptor kinase 2-like n=1 Tax=Papaver somniferum TaxID=3469 RepID=UPI000E6FDBF8|nr:wall-associated receptor kinase 2-like [Papaver somniferum]
MYCNLIEKLSGLTLTSSTTPLPQSKPGCEAKCGNVAIPYPFGIGPSENGCSFTGDGLQLYNITCNTSFNSPKPFLWLGTNLTSGKINMIELIGISDNEVRVKKSPATLCYEQKTGNVTLDESTNFLSTRNTPFTISSTKNKLFGIGCYSMGFIFEPNVNFSTSCVTSCETKENIVDGSCSGSGCCQVELPKGIKRFLNYADSLNATKESVSFNPCSYSFIGESDNYTFNASDILGTNFRTKGANIPIVLDWAIGNKTCEEAQKDMSTFACQKDSNCSNSDKVPGYSCTCNTGFMGNPYLSPGCQGIGLGFLFLIVASSLVYLSVKRNKLNELKEKFFRQNGGILLKQQLSSYEGGSQATKIFTAEELKAATNNYSDKLILGKGSFGTVYLGTLSDKSVVAIKKSKVIDESQIEQFINELVILSQVNHRNVVKVLGCCLESEVPLLVYEYISNGTLFQHIHNKVDGKSSSSLSWKIRLRIATESAGALAYLHSAASIPIIHRDIKSANILLDENYTAKVSDFGASRLNTLGLTQIDTLVQGTLGYLDPEYFETSQLTDKSDVYSFGVVLVELLTGEMPISPNRSLEQRSLGSFFLYTMERNDVFKLIQPQVANEGRREHVIAVAELARRCLSMEGGGRPTMKQVAAELESLSKSEIQLSGVNYQPSQELKPKVFNDEPTDLYYVPINSYTTGDSGQCSSMEKDVFKPMNMLRWLPTSSMFVDVWLGFIIAFTTLWYEGTLVLFRFEIPGETRHRRKPEISNDTPPKAQKIAQKMFEKSAERKYKEMNGAVAVNLLRCYNALLSKKVQVKSNHRNDEWLKGDKMTLATKMIDKRASNVVAWYVYLSAPLKPGSLVIYHQREVRNFQAATTGERCIVINNTILRSRE